MLGLDRAYGCLKEALQSMGDARSADIDADMRDALIRDAYEDLYQAVAQASLIYEMSTPYGEVPEGGFMGYSKDVVSEFCTMAHTRYYQEGSYPRNMVNDGENAEGLRSGGVAGSVFPGAEMDGIETAFENWFGRAKAFIDTVHIQAQKMLNSSYAKDSYSNGGRPVAGDEFR